MATEDITIEGIPGNALGAYCNGARITVHGTMQFGDTVIVVLYIPADMASQGETISIDEYESPLGLNDLYAQMGICVE